MEEFEVAAGGKTLRRMFLAVLGFIDNPLNALAHFQVMNIIKLR